MKNNYIINIMNNYTRLQSFAETILIQSSIQYEMWGSQDGSNSCKGCVAQVGYQKELWKHHEKAHIHVTFTPISIDAVTTEITSQTLINLTLLLLTFFNKIHNYR